MWIMTVTSPVGYMGVSRHKNTGHTHDRWMVTLRALPGAGSPRGHLRYGREGKYPTEASGIYPPVGRAGWPVTATCRREGTYPTEASGIYPPVGTATSGRPSASHALPLTVPGTSGNGTAIHLSAHLSAHPPGTLQRV
jgi:hypothetical protein